MKRLNGTLPQWLLLVSLALSFYYGGRDLADAGIAAIRSGPMSALPSITPTMSPGGTASGASSSCRGA